jgi:hypothetical protein
VENGQADGRAEHFPKTKTQLFTEILPINVASRGVVTGKREPRKSAAKHVQHKGAGLDAAPSQLPPEGPLWAYSLQEQELKRLAPPSWLWLVGAEGETACRSNAADLESLPAI